MRDMLCWTTEKEGQKRMKLLHRSRADHFRATKEHLVLYLLFFYGASVCGWLFEVAVYWTQNYPEFGFLELLAAYRGVLHGPWAPIYGVGAVLMVLLHRKIGARPGRFFLSCIGICGAVEYLTAWFLETVFHAKWWDYTGYFLNLHGRICAMSLLLFAAAGMSVARLAAPRFWTAVEKLPYRGRQMLCLCITVIFLADLVLSLASPNLGLGVQICG